MEVKTGYYLQQGQAEPGEIQSTLRLAGTTPQIHRIGRYTGGEHVTRIMHTRRRRSGLEHSTIYTLTNPDHARALFALIRKGK